MRKPSTVTRPPSGTLADMIRELAGTLGDDSNPLVVSLDVIWGAISSSSIVTGADPDDDEDPIEHYLYDNSDLTGLMGAYWDLQGFSRSCSANSA